MEVRLVVEKGNTRIRMLRLHARETLFGRRHGCQVRIPSAEVSRRHCVLRIREGYLTAEDLASANGTYLNGQRIQGRVVVRPGDQLSIGPLRFVVEYELSPAALERLRHRSANQTRSGERPANVPVAEEVLDGSATEKSLGVLPVAGKAASGSGKGLAVTPDSSASQDEVLPVAAEFEDEEDQWHLPQSEQLRDILSQMDEPPRQPRSRRP